MDLPDKVIATLLKACNDRVLIVLCRYHDDRHQGLGHSLAQLLAKFVTTHAWHHAVQEDEIWVLLLSCNPCQCILCIQLLHPKSHEGMMGMLHLSRDMIGEVPILCKDPRSIGASAGPRR